MKSFVFPLLTSAVVGGIINSLVSNRSKIKKYVSFAVSLVCILTLIQPIITILNETSEIKNSISSFIGSITYNAKINSTNEIIVKESKQRIEKGIKNLVIDKYKFQDNEVCVELILNEDKIDEIKIEKIYVYISGKSSWSDANSIENYLEGILGSDVSVKRR